MAPFSFIQCRAAEVSSPPEKAMPTFSPVGSDSRITDMLGKPFVGVKDQGLGIKKPAILFDPHSPYQLVAHWYWLLPLCFRRSNRFEVISLMTAVNKRFVWSPNRSEERRVGEECRFR